VDLAKLLGMFGVFMVPGGSVVLPAAIAAGKKFGVNIMPSAFKKEDLNELERLQELAGIILEQKEKVDFSKAIKFPDTKMLSIDFLMKIKKHDRKLEAKKGKEDAQSSLDRLRKTLPDKGLYEPPRIHIYKDGKVSMVQGNHRIVVLDEFGYKKVPTQIKYVESLTHEDAVEITDQEKKMLEI